MNKPRRTSTRLPAVVALLALAALPLVHLVSRAQDAPEVDELVYLDAAAPGLKAGEVCTVEITGFFEYDMTGRIVESVTDRAESHQSASSGAQG